MRASIVLSGAVLLLASSTVRAGWLESMVGQSGSRGDSPPGSAHQRLWLIREFSSVQLVPREAGAIENQEPVTIQVDALRRQLALVKVNVQGAWQAVFSADELSDIGLPLVQALGRAGPGDDLLLLSSSRRDGGILVPPTAVTARIFVQANALQIVVHDARFDFYDKYRGTYEAPQFTFGSRNLQGHASLQSSAASAPRADWLSIPLASLMSNEAPPSAPAQSPAATPSPIASPPPKPLDATGSHDIEERLETLKRLHDKGLITEDEYQQKRREILQLL